MSSLDACVYKLERDGSRLFEEFTKNLEEARARLSKCKYIRLVPSVEEEKIMRENQQLFVSTVPS